VAVTADAEYVLEGLEGPAEILVDRWGVPHMYASTLYDVFRVQGFNAARDRLWQLDFWRRRGLGLLAEVFGPSMVERDRASRLFYYRGDMQPEWLSYGSDTKRVATAFVEGVNAYIRLALQDRDLLPLEFRQLGYEPALWAPEDFARIRSNGLYYNLDSEVARALTRRARRCCRAATTGCWHPSGPPPADRCWPTIRTGRCRCRPCATWRTCPRPAWT
jgi:penicillin amidase